MSLEPGLHLQFAGAEALASWVPNQRGHADRGGRCSRTSAPARIRRERDRSRQELDLDSQLTFSRGASVSSGRWDRPVSLELLDRLDPEPSGSTSSTLTWRSRSSREALQEEAERRRPLADGEGQACAGPWYWMARIAMSSTAGPDPRGRGCDASGFRSPPRVGMRQGMPRRLA